MELSREGFIFRTTHVNSEEQTFIVVVSFLYSLLLDLDLLVISFHCQ